MRSLAGSLLVSALLVTLWGWLSSKPPSFVIVALEDSEFTAVQPSLLDASRYSETSLSEPSELVEKLLRQCVELSANGVQELLSANESNNEKQHLVPKLIEHTEGKWDVGVLWLSLAKMSEKSGRRDYFMNSPETWIAQKQKNRKPFVLVVYVVEHHGRTSSVASRETFDEHSSGYSAIWLSSFLSFYEAAGLARSTTLFALGVREPGEATRTTAETGPHKNQVLAWGMKRESVDQLDMACGSLAPFFST